MCFCTIKPTQILATNKTKREIKNPKARSTGKYIFFVSLLPTKPGTQVAKLSIYTKSPKPNKGKVEMIILDNYKHNDDDSLCSHKFVILQRILDKDKSVQVEKSQGVNS